MAFHSQKSPLLGPHQLQNEDFPAKTKHIYSGKMSQSQIRCSGFQETQEPLLEKKKKFVGKYFIDEQKNKNMDA